VAEGGGLLNRYTVISRIVGSNPIPSATPFTFLSSFSVSTLGLLQCRHGEAEPTPWGPPARNKKLRR
jgi:hypothetical protein